MGAITSKLFVAVIDQISAPARGVAQVVKNMQAQPRANATQMNEMRGQMVDAAATAFVLGRALADPFFFFSTAIPHSPFFAPPAWRFRNFSPA
jgi:hypothetical protein